MWGEFLATMLGSSGSRRDTDDLRAVLFPNDFGRA
jgi:hypothetical protein